MSADTEITKVIECTERSLEPSELAYFKRVSEGLVRAAQLDTEATTLHEQAVALRGAHDSWTAYLIERYQLDPATDEINPETGAIERSERSPNGHAGPG